MSSKRSVHIIPFLRGGLRGIKVDIPEGLLSLWLVRVGVQLRRDLLSQGLLLLSLRDLHQLLLQFRKLELVASGCSTSSHASAFAIGG